MVSISIDRAQVQQLQEVLGDLGKSIRKELAIAVNATAKKARLDMGREIREDVAISKTTVESSLKVRGKASSAAPTVTVALERSDRIQLRDFAARQNKKGVTYKINKREPRKLAPSAFKIPRYLGKVFKRKGKARGPLTPLRGASAIGAFRKNKHLGPQLRETRAELRKQIDKRIKYQVLKAAGKLRGRQAA